MTVSGIGAGGKATVWVCGFLELGGKAVPVAFVTVATAD